MIVIYYKYPMITSKARNMIILTIITITTLAMTHKDLNGQGIDIGPIYIDPSIVSIGGSISSPIVQLGGVIGFDHFQLFGSYNINHKIQASFGVEENN